jgi:spermidine synthase
MKLTKVIQQDRLLYFSRLIDAMSVSENKHYRWLAFEQVVQSLMLKRVPWQLTLPHQFFMLLPLLFFKPNNIVEFGLGGGNLLRYLERLAMLNHAVLSLTSIERDSRVVECFYRYFAGTNGITQIITCDASAYIAQHNISQFDWLIYDIFCCATEQHQTMNITQQHCQTITTKLNNNGWFTLNIPDATEPELALIIANLQRHLVGFRLCYFKITQYRNVIVHIYPAHINVNQTNSYLSLPMQHRMQMAWRLGVNPPTLR